MATPSKMQMDEHAHRTIERLVYQTWWDADVDAGINARDLFTEDAVIKMPARMMQGLAELLAGYKARQARGPRLSRHLVHNLRIDMPTPELAVANYMAVLYAKNGVAPMEASTCQAVCDVRDECVPQHGTWRISKREVTTIFIAPDHDSVMLVSPGQVVGGPEAPAEGAA